jgi:hypothetical protein
MPVADALDRGRELFARHVWEDAFAHLSAADRAAALELEAGLRGSKHRSVECL